MSHGKEERGAEIPVPELFWQAMKELMHKLDPLGNRPVSANQNGWVGPDTPLDVQGFDYSTQNYDTWPVSHFSLCVLKNACLVVNRLAMASPTAAPTATIALPRRHYRSHCHFGTAYLTRHIRLIAGTRSRPASRRSPPRPPPL